MASTTIVGFTPPARYDDVPWISARIEQSATETGSYTELETIPLNPVSVDPRNPDTYGFTTQLATDGDWLRIVWLDEAANESDPTEPIQLLESDADPFATRDELAALLKVDATTNATALDRVLAAAAFEIERELGAESLSGGALALATEVNLERAAEHWAQLKSPFGFSGVFGDTGPIVAAKDTWERHAIKLAYAKQSWGIA